MRFRQSPAGSLRFRLRFGLDTSGSVSASLNFSIANNSQYLEIGVI